jgi:hypothetical protein
MLGFNESDMDGPNKFACGEIEDLVGRTIIGVSNENAAERFRGEFVLVAVLHAEVGRATKDL